MIKYELYWAKVPYRETEGEKNRPILIMNDAAFLVSALPVTSQGKSSEFQYEISRWAEAGLDRQSYIVLEPIRIEDKSLIGDRIGRLQSEDIFRLEMRLLE